MRKILFFLLPFLLIPNTAYAQCNGQGAAGTICSNITASQAPPKINTFTATLDRLYGSTTGQMIYRSSGSGWTGSATPQLGVNGGTGGAITLNGSTSGSAQIGVAAAAGSSILFQLPSTNGSPNFILQTDGSGHLTWTAAGGGTVSSVALALPASTFSVSGSPVTSTGTLTGAFTTQSANVGFFGPTTGAAATPTWRALVGADLPNPTTSTLGGVQAINAVTSNWIKSINTSGVPQLSQPAFTDISGTLAASQCPNPSASTNGCVESYVAVAHQWINAISTGGVPSSTQPGFADISGNASLSQLPSISNNSIIANNSGGTSIPSALSASNVLDMINNVQGDILYRNASTWVALAPGINGQVLTTGGAAANLSWTSVTGTGTVTSIATNNGVTGGTITTSGTIGLATIATGNALAYTGGGSGVPVATTPSTLLDVIGSSTGDILYRSSGGWAVLAPGSNGQVLTQGATTPSWGNAGSVTNVTISAGTGISATGTCNITTTGTCTVGLTSARQTLPTISIVTTGSHSGGFGANGSGTYTTPANVLWIEIEMEGGGSGGSGLGSSGNANATCWNTTGSACSTPVYSAGGGTGGGGGGAITGSSTCNVAALTGSSGQGGSATVTGTSSSGGIGGNTPLMGAGIGVIGSNGGAANANTGSGGGGGGVTNQTGNTGSGGGSGATCKTIINSPAATYTYTVGTGSAGASASGAVLAGGNGADGRITVIEHYGS